MFKQGTYVLVCDSYRGVYGGELLHDYDGKEDHVLLTNARHVFYYETTNGTYQLSIDGPIAGSKVGPVMDRFMVRSVANVAECTQKAKEQWAAASWV